MAARGFLTGDFAGDELRATATVAPRQTANKSQALQQPQLSTYQAETEIGLFEMIKHKRKS